MRITAFFAALFLCVASTSAYPLAKARSDKPLLDLSDLDACAAVLVRVHTISPSF